VRHGEWLAKLRAGSTEPVKKVIVEAKDHPTTQKYIDEVLKIQGQALGY